MKNSRLYWKNLLLHKETGVSHFHMICPVQYATNHDDITTECNFALNFAGTDKEHVVMLF